MHGLIPSLHEWKQGVRYGLVALTLAFVVWKSGAIALGILPFAVAFGISVLIDPVVARLAALFRVGRAWSSLVVISLFLLAVWWIGSGILAITMHATARFLEEFPQYRETVVAYVQGWTVRLSRVYAALPPDVAQIIAENTSRLGEAVEQLLSGLGRQLFSLVRTVPGVVTAGLLIPLATFFMSKDLPALKRLLWSLVPEQDRPRVRRVLGDLWGSAWKYLRAQAVLILITMSIATAGLLVIGIDNWFAAGLLIGLLDLLPVVGPTVAFLPWALYLVIVGQTTLALYLGIVYLAAVGTRALVEPKVVGDSIGLHPLTILAAMYGGALLLGVAGAIVGPVSVLVCKVVYRAWRLQAS